MEISIRETHFTAFNSHASHKCREMKRSERDIEFGRKYHTKEDKVFFYKWMYFYKNTVPITLFFFFFFYSRKGEKKKTKASNKAKNNGLSTLSSL